LYSYSIFFSHYIFKLHFSFPTTFIPTTHSFPLHFFSHFFFSIPNILFFRYIFFFIFSFSTTFIPATFFLHYIYNGIFYSFPFTFFRVHLFPCILISTHTTPNGFFFFFHFWNHLIFCLFCFIFSTVLISLFCFVFFFCWCCCFYFPPHSVLHKVGCWSWWHTQEVLEFQNWIDRGKDF